MRFSGRIGVAMAGTLALALVATGCNFKKDGAVAASAPDVVTVIASVDPADSATTVALDPSTVGALGDLGVSLKPSGTAYASGSSVSFPITSGYVEIHRKRSVKPGWIDGSLDHQGSGINVVGPGTTVRLSDFVVDPGNSMLYGSVNGTIGVPLLFLDGTNVTASSNSAGQEILNGTVAKLTPQAATALDRAFATSSITAGTPLGRVQVLVGSGEPLPAGADSLTQNDLRGSVYETPPDKVTSISRLTGTSTTLTLEPAVAQALSGAGLTLAPTGSASAAGTTSSTCNDAAGCPAASGGGAGISFPITAGFVAIHSNKGFQPGYVVGTVDHQGSGIRISGGGTSITLSDFVVDPGDSVLTGTVDGKLNVPLFFLDGSHLTVTPTSGGATLDGTVAELTKPAAEALDQRFSTRTFTPGMAIGTVHLVATGS